MLLDKENNQDRIDGAIGAETMSLNQITGSADGLQMVRDELLANRHYANVLYNVMRGGLPLFGYLIVTPTIAMMYFSFNNKGYWRKSTMRMGSNSLSSGRSSIAVFCSRMMQQ